ncbi:MAG TPA: zinc-dependent alcohol dehydrogenase family protein [Phycisphaerae bacterium]|nr:zinc-dependent alcohol dehydrogenase family protein [Phycisphaerae bacterium]
MKAMVLDKPCDVKNAPLEFRDVAVPEPADGQVLLRVKSCGVCHTDLHTVVGELPLHKRPIVPGHEIVGVVEKCGRRCGKLKVGDRVGAAWLAGTCGTCKFCRRGDENLCPNARFTGYDIDGGYAEYAAVLEDFAYRVPDSLDDAAAAPLLCAGIIGYRSLKLAEFNSGKRLGLYGFGASAHIAIQVAVHRGCEVYVFSRSELHRSLAQRLGATWTGQAQDEFPEKLDSAVIFAPAGWLVREALRVLDRGGVLALAGIYMSSVPELDYERHLYYERTVRSVTAATRQDGHELMELAGRIPIRTTVETYDLQEANEVLRRLEAGQIDGAAVLRCG